MSRSGSRRPTYKSQVWRSHAVTTRRPPETGRNTMQSADKDLIPDQFPEMNRRFHDSHPADYFDLRLATLLVAASRSDVIQTTLRDGIEIGLLKLRAGDDDIAGTDNISRYAITDAIVLLHHASEALLRLYLAHERQPECPWLEMARLRGRGVFPRGIERLITERDSKHQRDNVSRWFLGSDVAHVIERGGPDGRSGKDAVEGANQFLVATAERLLKESDVYNSAKHGMSVLPGDRGMKYGDHDFPIDLSMNGPSLAYLEMRPKQPKVRKRWAETTTWVQLDGSLAWIRLVTQQMRNLWSVAGLVYLDIPASINPIFPDQVQAVVTAGKTNTYNIDTLSMELAYYVETPPHHPNAMR